MQKDNKMVNIRRATHADADWMQTSFETELWQKRDGYFHQCCKLQDEDKLVLLVAHDGDQYVGHCKIVWEPGYPYYRENNIPEIQDLNIVLRYRRQGIASRMVEMAENIISERSDTVGIGFGLYRDYGAAQRMYILRGYVPDGQGIVYHDEYVKPGETVKADDDLVLHLVKKLR